MLEQVSQYRHYRNIKTGNIYYVWAIAKHSENPSELLVCYRPKPSFWRFIKRNLFNFFAFVVSAPPYAEEFWVRPLELFKEKFEEIASDQ